MKKLLSILILATFALPAFANTLLQSSVSAPVLREKMVQAGLPQQFNQMTVEDFLNLTPGKVKEMTGQKLKFKQVVTLKAAQKAIRKDLGREDDAAGTAKSQVVALILVCLVGTLGIHRFYLGYTTIGIIQLLTAGGCGIWALIDLIQIVTGDLRPADGSDYDPKL